MGDDSRIAELERQLAAEHQMASIGRLLASIVHEINTPIGSIFSNNEVISRSLEMAIKLLDDARPESLAKAKKLLSTCHSLTAVDKIACERISSVVRGLKTFARVDSSELRRVNLNENILNTLKLTQGEFRRRITVETHLSELPEVECYPQMLNQVFLNLLVNAGHAIEGEGKITVRTAVDGDMVHISIADTGKGIPPEIRDRIFEGGFTTKPVGVGTGLGLPLSRKIVEETHGGVLEFETETGKGTTFHVRIPVRPARHAAG